MDLKSLGWSSSLAAQFADSAPDGLVPARVAREHKHQYVVLGEHGALGAAVSGKLRHTAAGRDEYPTVGDWVAIQPRVAERRATIHRVLPRSSAFSRKVAGENTEEQIIAANVDRVLLVSGLDGEFNLRRIERYLTVAWDSGAAPVIVLNKADLCADIDARVAEVEAIAVGTSILVVSVLTGVGLEALRALAGPGTTVALLGSSGVGKSSLVNALLGEARLRVGSVREDDSHGRHTTTYKELLVLPGGGVVIDTPGMRELQLWTTDEALGGAFADVEELATRCRFRDCRHESEPGCAVHAALDTGGLSAERFRSYQKLQKELAHLHRKQDVAARLAEQSKWKRITIAARKLSRPG